MHEKTWMRSSSCRFDNRKSKTCPEPCRRIRNLKWLGLSVIAFVLVALSVPAGAQQAKKVPRIGLLSTASAPASARNIEAFRQGLRDLGYIEGQNIVIEYRYAEGWADRLPGLIAELSQLNVDIMVVAGASGALAAKKAKISVPVVFVAVTDPFEQDMIASLARPGGNMTGTSLAVGEGFSGKWVELLKETVPKLAKLSALWNPTHPVGQVFVRQTELAARALRVGVKFFEARDPAQLGSAFSGIERERAKALLVTPDPLFFSERARIVDFALHHRLPSTFLFREFAESGGLMAYGPSISDSYRRGAFYVDKILKGTKPADLPVEQPIKFEFVINLKTAKQIGLTIPPNVLARADKVIR